MLRMLVIGYTTAASFDELAAAIIATGKYESVDGIPVGDDMNDLAQEWLDRNSGKKIALLKGNGIETAGFLRIIIGRRKFMAARGMEDDLGIGRLTHSFIFHTPDGGKFIITDGSIVPEPDQDEKLYSAEMAINLWENLFGNDQKLNVSVISASGHANPKIRSSMDGLYLIEKLSYRANVRLDQLDTALFPDAAVAKGMPNKPMADILIAHDLDSGNGYYKLLAHSGYLVAGLVLGARVPICLNSRADGIAAKVLSAEYAAEIGEKL
jgi:phosphate butyryltransferase